MPASPSTARAINDRLALGLLQDRGPLTAGQLKQLTGLSRPTVADLVERLGAAGLITVVGESGAARRGPNARLYGIAADRAHLAALDVRTEGVAVLVADLVGRVLAEASVPIEGDTGTGPAVQRVVAAVAGAVGRAGVEGPHTVGIGAPGLIDPATGDLRDSAGLPAWHRSLSAALQERLPGARVTVENETNLAALAEQREGAARDRDTFVLLWLGHGTGAAVVLDGTLRRGASGGTGEIGFLPVPGTPTLPSATDCSGGFHTLAGAAAVVSLGAEHGLPAPATTDGPGAAGMVRGAVERVLAAREPAGAGGALEESGAGERPGGGGAVASAVGETVGARGAAAAAGEHEPGNRSAGVAGESVARWDAAAGRPGGRKSRPVAEERPVVGGGAWEELPAAGEPVMAREASGGGPLETRGGEEPPAVDEPTGREPVTAADPAGTAAGADERFLSALADRIAIGAASVVAVLDPGCVVLGGEIGHAGGDVLAGLVAQRLRRMSPLPTEVRAGALGGSAVLRGALLTARDRAQDTLWSDPSRSPVPS
ncbi:ROK family transcriptional regulator [Streptomyces griseofuscus]|uniref:ROK family transcriptional regulator n=1 Tax=Streptomyces griseofuscus TaxID=146922 RepID=UPI0033D1757C